MRTELKSYERLTLRLQSSGSCGMESADAVRVSILALSTTGPASEELVGSESVCVECVRWSLRSTSAVNSVITSPFSLFNPILSNLTFTCYRTFHERLDVVQEAADGRTREANVVHFAYGHVFALVFRPEGLLQEPKREKSE